MLFPVAKGNGNRNISQACFNAHADE